MKILFVTPTEVDQSSGAAVRSRHLLGALSAVAETYVLRVAQGDTCALEDRWDDRRQRRATRTTDGFSARAMRERRTLRAGIGALLVEERFDLIVARYPSTALLFAPGLWPRLVIDADDAFKFPPGGGGVSIAGRLRIWARNRFVRHLCERAAHAWFVHPRDARMLTNARKSLLGNVVDFPATVSITPQDPRQILMVGAFFYPPNADGLRWFVRQVLPTLRERFPTIRMHVVGKTAPALASELAHSAIDFLGFVDDLSAEYGRASLVVAPIFVGAGTQIKVIDALAHGRPLVATDLAYSGFADDLVRDAHLRVESGREGWIRACLWILENGRDAEDMAQRGREAARVFGVEGLFDRVRDTIASLSSNELRPIGVAR